MSEITVNGKLVTLPAGWRSMRDSSSPFAIPSSPAPDIVAGYVDGWPAWRMAGVWTRWPKSQHVRITVVPRELAEPWTEASIVDDEARAYDDLTSRRFVVARNGYRPGTATVYRQLSGLRALGRALQGLHYWVWVAFWPAFPTSAEIDAIRAELAPGARLAGIQYRNEGLFDSSVIIDPDWHPAR